jgi:RNA polymerase sigma-70 factor (ECF subfamily)
VDELTRLAQAAASGDRIALHGFVRASQSDVWRLCARLSDRDRADDLVQETYVRALRAMPDFRAESSARTWLLSIARRTVYDSYRARSRRRRAASRFDGPATQPDASGEVGLRLAVAALEPERRAAFVLTQELGLSYQEAAEVCGCAVGTIRSRVARARRDLIEVLGTRSALSD